MSGLRTPASGSELIRVRSRDAGRHGRIAPDPCLAGQARLLFDGETRPKSVPAGAVEYLDAPGQPRS